MLLVHKSTQQRYFLYVCVSLSHTHTHLQTGGLLGNNHQVVIVALTLLLAEFLQLRHQVGVAQGGTQAVLVLLLHKSTQQRYDTTLFCG